LILIDPLAAIGAPDIFLKLMVGLRPKEVKSQALIGGANITSLQIIDKRLLFDGESIRQRSMLGVRRENISSTPINSSAMTYPDH
jgi:hypothetical protein